MAQVKTIWRETPSVEWFERTRQQTLVQHLDIRITQFGPDYLRGTMPVNSNTRQYFGILHGGASVALAETLGSVGCTLCIDTNRSRCVGLEINANHLRAVSDGIVTGTARPFHLGRRTHVWGIEICNDEGKLACISRITLAILDLDAKGAT
jgi:1,4-dihydroxy-2-naphthoyl-CoA hydrolase